MTEAPDEPPPKVVLETDRLILRTWTLSDVEPFHAICADPLVMQFVQTGEPWTRSQTTAMIETALATEKQHGFSRWALIHKPDAALIGFCGFVPAADGAEIGWRLAAPYWGRGLATEAAQAAMNHGFQTCRFPRIIATVQAANHASLRVTEKLGLKYTHSFQRTGREILVFAATNPDGSSR